MYVKTKIVFMRDEIGVMLEYLEELYINGKIKAISIQLLTEDGELHTGNAGNIDFVTLVGMLETAKMNKVLSASGVI